MPIVKNITVECLEHSILRSGYPFLDAPLSEDEFSLELAEIFDAVLEGDRNNPHIKRAIKLANAKGGGHDQYLTGIRVSFDLDFTIKAWVEAERYTFLEFVSSMSTMHRIAQLNIKDSCNRYVWSETIQKLEAKQSQYLNTTDKEEKKELYLEILYNIPVGFQLTAGMTLNYRCLKNIYEQRRTHRLPDWQEFCDWIETLPMAAELITGKYIKEKKGA